MNNDLLNFLKEYVANPQIQVPNELSVEEKKILPDSWLDILKYDGNERVNKALEYWKPFKNILGELLNCLETNLISIELIYHDFGYSLLYEVSSTQKKKSLYYEARNPNSKNISPSVASKWHLLPEEFKNFYDFHNGWYHFASNSMGLSPVEDFFFLDDEDWGILEKIETPAVDMTKALSVFANGMGSYICLELNEKNIKPLIWWKHKAPKLDLDFWPFIDAWTVIGLEG